MDDVQLQRAPEGGMEIRMTKRILRATRPRGRLSGSRSRYLSRPPSRRSFAPATCRWRASATISVSTRRAPSISSPRSIWPSSGCSGRSWPNAFRRHEVLAEELGGGASVPPGPCWVFDPIDGTTNFAHGLPIFCASLALEIDGVAEVGAIYDPTRKELFTAERGGGAFLNGRPLRVSSREHARRRDAGHRFPVRRPLARRARSSACSARSSARRAPCGGSARRPSICATSPPDAWMDSGRAILKPWDIAAGALIVAEAGGRVTNMDGEPFTSRGGQVLATNGLLHDAMLGVIRDYRGR